jgi:hypothetical protein
MISEIITRGSGGLRSHPLTRTPCQERRKITIDVTTENAEVLLWTPIPIKPFFPCPITGDYILITRLQPDQEIAGATASKGTADMHASYAVVSIASYGYERDEDAIEKRVRRYKTIPNSTKSTSAMP